MCQLPGLGFISRVSGENIPLNGGEAMCWQGPALALFQLHGIKDRRYGRQRIVLEPGEGREDTVYKMPELCLCETWPHFTRTPL